MNLRKMLSFKNILGITLPKEYTNALGLEKGGYCEVFLRDKKTIVVKKHGVEPKKLTVND